MDVFSREYHNSQLKVFSYICPVPPTGGATGAVCPGPPVWGGPQTMVQTRSGSLLSSQSRSIVDFMLFGFALTLPTQTSILHTWLLRSRWLGPRTFYFLIWNHEMKTATGRYVCTVCRLAKEPQKPLEHTSEHVKSQKKIPEGVPPDPQSIVGAPLYVFVPGPHNPLGGPVYAALFYGIIVEQRNV